MKRKTKVQSLIMLFILFSLSCEGELEDCYETVCTGPDNTNCREEPNFGSGCFPLDNSSLQPESPIRQ